MGAAAARQNGDTPDAEPKRRLRRVASADVAATNPAPGPGACGSICDTVTIVDDPLEAKPREGPAGADDDDEEMGVLSLVPKTSKAPRRAASRDALVPQEPAGRTGAVTRAAARRAQASASGVEPPPAASAGGSSSSTARPRSAAAKDGAATTPARAPPAKAAAKAPPAPAAAPSYTECRFARMKSPLLSAKEKEVYTVAFEDIGAKLKDVLERHGTAIVTGVASAEECRDLERRFASDLAELVDLDVAKGQGAASLEAAKLAASDAKRWPLPALSLIGPMERCQSRGLPHGSFAWGARMLPRVRRVYAVLHDTEELVSSCDNSFFAPPAHRKEAANRVLAHVDQNAYDDRFKDERGRNLGEWDVYQGILYVWGSVEEHASTTVVWPGSHKAPYDTMMADDKVQKAGKQGRHFTQINSMGNRAEAGRLMAGFNEASRRLVAPAGSLVLWSSKTVHQGWRGGPRLAQPVCWEPVARRPPEARERKLRLCALGLPSTHWASLGLPHSLLGAGPGPDSATDGKLAKGGKTIPLRASLQPRPLVDGAKVADMWKRLQSASWAQPLPPDLVAFLERSIREEYKKVL